MRSDGMVKLQFGDHEGFGSNLLCPACGGEYLKHIGVEVFERKEDAEDGIHVLVRPGLAHVDTNIANNPSPRRHGFSVHFVCEQCGKTSIMHVVQHKGVTYMGFEG